MITKTRYKSENGALKMKLPIRNPLADYECWYFESILDNGDQVRISYRINETYGLPILYGVQVELIHNGKVSVFTESFTSNEVEFSTEKCNHKLGNNWMLDLGEYFEIYVEINGITIQLKFYPEIDGFNNVRDSIVNRNILGTRYMAWNVPVPKARVKGFIDQKGQKKNISGIGYHDHVWGNSIQDKGIKQLCLGKIHDSNLSIYYTFIIERDQSILSKLIVANKDNVILATESTLYDEGLKAKIINYAIVEDTEDKIPQEIFVCNNIIELNIVFGEMFSRQELRKHRLGGKRNIRLFGSEFYKINMESGKFSGNTESLHEILIF